MKHSLVLVAITVALSWEGAGRSSLAQSTQHLISTDAVPKELSASDWTSIRAAHQVALKGSRLASAEHARPTAPAADPIAQQAYVKASNTDSGDTFGIVAISGNTVVVGAFGEASDADGVNGDQSDNSSPSTGAAYVFVRNGAVWSQQAYLKASNSDTGAVFGISVAISGDTIVVGAAGAGVSGTGLAYVFVRNGTTWSQEALLKASNADGADAFGATVAVSGDTVVVGAPFEASKATGVNGDETDNSAFSAGAAYIFVRNGTTWSQQAYLKASNTDPGDNFGTFANHLR